MENLKNSKKPSGPINVKNWVVQVDRNKCIGSGTCVATASKSFTLDSESKAAILATIDSEEENMILEAAKSCPVSAILIRDKKGSNIFPE